MNSLMLTLGLIACLVLAGSDLPLPVAPLPREKALLRCEMRWTGKGDSIIAGKQVVWDIPDGADVLITNITDAALDIGSKAGPEGNLDLRLKDPAGSEVKTEPGSGRLCTQSLLEPTPYFLKPARVYRIQVDLLGTLPEEKRVAGTYKVMAIYTVGKRKYESGWVEIKWPLEKK